MCGHEDYSYLKEPASGLSQISRDHFAIERMEDQFFVVDRGNVTGTIVAERRIGGRLTMSPEA